MKIHPEALKLHRQRTNLSQEELAEKAKVSKKTISRIETGQEGNDSRPRTVKQLAGALGVDESKLTTWPQHKTGDEADVDDGYFFKKITINVAHETALAFAFIESKYNVATDDILSISPLLFLIVAEDSLRWRRDNLDTFVQQAECMIDNIDRNYFVPPDEYADEWNDWGLFEEKSIKEKDVFGSYVYDQQRCMGRDLQDTNIFARYIRQKLRSLGASFVSIRAFGIDSMPSFAIAREEIKRITGGDERAECALIHGFARIRDIPPELQGDEAQNERVRWLSGKVPQEKWEKLRCPLLDF